MDGVRIGNGAVVGAHSTVTKDVPPYAIVAGSPARIIRYRFSEEIIHKLNRIKWWYWDMNKIKQNEKYFCSTDISAFANNFYSPERDSIIHTDFSDMLAQRRQEGFKVVYYEPDFSDNNRVYFGKNVNERVIEQLFDAYHTKNNILLVMRMGKDDYFKYKDDVVALHKACCDKNGLNPPMYIMASDSIKLSVLQQTDYVIINHLESCMMVVDYASDYGAQILSGFSLYIYKQKSEKFVNEI